MSGFSNEQRREAKALLLKCGIDLSGCSWSDQTIRDLLDEQVVQGNACAAELLTEIYLD